MLIFGEPYKSDTGVVIVTVSRTGWFGRTMHPVGIYTITGDRTKWTPAVDNGRAALIGVCTGFMAATLLTATLLRRPPWPDLNERVMMTLKKSRHRELLN